MTILAPSNISSVFGALFLLDWLRMCSPFLFDVISFFRFCRGSCFVSAKCPLVFFNGLASLDAVLAKVGKCGLQVGAVCAGPLSGDVYRVFCWACVASMRYRTLGSSVTIFSVFMSL